MAILGLLPGVIVPGWLHAQSIDLDPLGIAFDQPVFVTGAGDGTNRLFVVEQAGVIRVLASPDAAQAPVFLDGRNRVLAGGERGLLGLAFHPGFRSNRRFFVNYTRRPDGASVVAEYEASPDGATASPVEKVLLEIPQPYPNHNGGMLAFGPDGYLYIGAGDGGSGNDPGNRAQNRGELLGKILRIDVDGAGPGESPPYAIPASNPFVGSGGRDEIYALGLRNPWRFSFDRATGTLWAGDVGQNAREEIDVVEAGGNYGWRVREGTRCTGLGPGPCSDPALVDPVAEYDNGILGRCSVTGGYVYRGLGGPLPYGAYVFGDYCSGEIFTLDDGVMSVAADTAWNITSFGTDDAGELYVVAQSGEVLRIAGDGPPAPMPFDTTGGGLESWASLEPPALTTGYASIAVAPGASSPSGAVIVDYAPSGTLDTETAFEAGAPRTAGRVRADAGTGVAIANPGAGTVTVSFSFTGDDSGDLGAGSLDLQAGTQISGFLAGPPFNGPAAARSTWSFEATAPVLVAALEAEVNAHGRFIMAARPVFGVGDPPPPDRQWIPLAAGGEGWSTDIVLVNGTDSALSGQLTIRLPSEPANDMTLEYGIPPRGSRTFSSGNAPGAARLGFVRVQPDPGTPMPGAFSHVRSSRAGVAVSATSIPAAAPRSSARLLVESSGDAGLPGAVRHAVALVNTGGAGTVVTYELLSAAGSSTVWSGSLSLPASGYAAAFLDQLPGLENMPEPFVGTLAITSSSAPVAMTNLRTRWNARGDFLFAAIGPYAEGGTAFPFFATGSGYRVRFVLLPRESGASGDVHFFRSDGTRIPPPLR